MMVTMRSIMRLSGPPRPPPKLPREGGGPSLGCPYAGVDGGPAPLLQPSRASVKDISRANQAGPSADAD